MTIDTSVIISQTTQANGSILVHERHTDHTGQTYDAQYTAPNGTDLNALLTIRAARIEETLKIADLNRAIFTTPWGYTLVHATNTELRDYVRELYRESEKEQTALIALRIVEWIDNGKFTTAQIRQAFGLNNSQWNTLRTKMENLIANYQAVDGAMGE